MDQPAAILVADAYPVTLPCPEMYPDKQSMPRFLQLAPFFRNPAHGVRQAASPTPY
jgi:hypothetical protein